MIGEVPELSMAQKDGAPPATLGAGSAPGESGVSVLSARFEGAIHVSATSRRRHHVFFGMSGPLRDDFHVRRGEVGIGIDRQFAEGDRAPNHKYQGGDDDQEALR